MHVAPAFAFRMPRTRSCIIQVILLTWVSTQAAPMTTPDEESFNHPVVNTIYGQVRGHRMFYSGKTVDEFKGIPFAKPPIGELRWQRPESPEPWTGRVLNATEYGAACTQWLKDVKNNGESCLFLNVWIPEGIQNRLKTPVPVMVWTYGGGFQTGSSQIYPAHEIAARGDVIVVSHNYRVSVLGGLSTSDANSPGNYMLWDARAALLWVRDNIANFGGDPSRITIFGASAGGAIVSHIVASPLCKGLFHRALTLSGVASGPVGNQVDNVENARNVALLEGCPSENDDMAEMIQCLRTREAKEVDRAGYPAMVMLTGQVPGWAPVVDGQFVPVRAKTAYANGAGSDVDYIAGSCHDDAAGFVFSNMRGLPDQTGNIASTRETLYAILTFVLRSYTPNGDTDVLVRALVNQYPLLNSSDVTARTQEASRVMTDHVFMEPANYEATMHSQNCKKAGTGKKTFVYDFNYRPSFVHYAPWVTGSHTDDHYLLFGESYRRKLRETKLGNFTVTDKFVGDSMVKYYANFAYTGDPNKGPHKVPAAWPEFESTTQQYMEFAASMTAKKVDADMQSRIDFWQKEWPKITVAYNHRQIQLNGPEENMTAFRMVANMVADYLMSMGSID